MTLPRPDNGHAPDTSGAAIGPMRLARALSVLGAASRRQAEQLVRGGHVRCNGGLVTDPAHSVNLSSDTISLDGRLLHRERPRYLALHKPPDIVTTVRDPHANRTVVQ